MATTISKYSSINQYLWDGTAPLNGTTHLKLALVTSAYAFSASDSVWAAASGSELANGNGYTTGGNTITTPVSALSAGIGVLTADNSVWTFSGTKTFMAGILYHNQTINAVVNPLIAYILFDNTPADIVITAGQTFGVQWSGGQVLTVTAPGP
jgi:hypothetical protein